jgi:hypothetical protein
VNDVATDCTNGLQHSGGDHAGGRVLLFSVADIDRVLRTNGLRPLLVAGAAFFPVGVVHGIGVWFGGW